MVSSRSNPAFTLATVIVIYLESGNNESATLSFYIITVVDKALDQLV